MEYVRQEDMVDNCRNEVQENEDDDEDSNDDEDEPNEYWDTESQNLDGETAGRNHLFPRASPNQPSPTSYSESPNYSSLAHGSPMGLYGHLEVLSCQQAHCPFFVDPNGTIIYPIEPMMINDLPFLIPDFQGRWIVSFQGTHMVSTVLRQYIDRFYKPGEPIAKFHKDVPNEGKEFLFKECNNLVYYDPRYEVYLRQAFMSKCTSPTMRDGSKKDQHNKKGKSGSKKGRHVAEKFGEDDNEDEDDDVSFEEFDDPS
ncbi:hypothetical protein CRG98_020733 [Punica granatum]|uniref:Uncharacterized protein n=1 Tax=Punica granatum TaxID=22663 RepID=A0A2I0JRH6_PUNGR|nr:hypothetical protein CRG98_020733 [Punica granatum]